MAALSLCEAKYIVYLLVAKQYDWHCFERVACKGKEAYTFICL